MIRLLAALVLTLGSPALATSSPWQQLAIGDVERLHQSVTDFHPGMRDSDTPDFAQRVESAYRIAKDRALAATSYADWLAATQGFMLSFRDGHTIFRPTLSPARVRWPGFLIDGRAGGWVVRRPAGFRDNGRMFFSFQLGGEDALHIASYFHHFPSFF